MLKTRTVFLLWLGLVTYAALQAFLVARSGVAPFVGVFLYDLVGEHIRFAAIVAMLWVVGRYARAWGQWRQIGSYLLWTVATALLVVSLNLAMVKFLGREQAFANIWNNKHWIFLQNFLENALILAGFVVAQYRHELKQRESREQELRLLTTQMELTALRSQLNPHFLFNALNAVNAHVGVNPERARRVLEMLADLLRYTLESDKRELVQLGEELDFVRKYLSIEQERFGKRLHCCIETSDAPTNALIPPMLIQPLVENAVKHGISPKAAGGTVTVRVSTESDKARLRVEISDDGVGMKATQVQTPTQNTVKTGSTGSTSSTGIGLTNTDARLRKLFGEDSALHIQTTEQGVVAWFSVPLRLKALASS